MPLHRPYSPSHMGGVDPALQPHPFMGWPSLICTWAVLGWIAGTICTHAKSPLYHEPTNGSTKLDSNWYFVLWAAVVPQLLFFCVYGGWVGWKFFMHN